MTVLLHGRVEQKVIRKGIDMAAVYASLNSFNAGELSPKMLGRVDVSQYAKGCQVLRNFLVTPYGAAERRPGTKFLCRTKYDDKAVRLIRFVFSAGTAYVCEFGDHYIRFIRNDAMIVDENGDPFEIESPYSETELNDLKYIQSADVMTIVHPDHPVQELKRITETLFTLSEKEFTYPPMLDPNLDDNLTITPSGESLSAGSAISLAASGTVFDETNIGGYFQLIHVRKENEISKDFKSDGVSDSLEVRGYWTFTTHGTWTGQLTIQRSFDGGITWKDYRTYSSSKDSNTSTSGEEEEDDVLYRLKMSDYEQSSTGTIKLCRCNFVNPDFQITGVVRIHAVSSPTLASGTVVRKLGGSEPTNEWNEGAWSIRRGFPGTIAFYEERMMFGGTKYRPQTIWGSKTNDWKNFKLGSLDDDGLEFTLASDTVNQICWMCQHEALVIGTMDSEWILSASSQEQALTPSNFRVRRQSVYGSAGISAQMVGDTILFTQRGSRKVREFVYRWEKDGYSAPDMTILAEHITGSGIRETSLQQLPDTILWCVLGNGTLSALTYERDQEVIGWHRHETNGKFLSICIIPDGDEDQIFFAAERRNGRFIERMDSRKKESAFETIFADSAITCSGSGMISVSGLEHLEGETVQVVADGAVQKEKTVENGAIPLDDPADVVTVGLGYESLLSPMPLEIELANGASMLRKKAIGELRIRMYGSTGGEVRAGNDHWQKIISRDILLDSMDSPIRARDDVHVFNLLSGNEYTPNIEVRQTDPLPMNISSMVATYEVVER